MDVREVKGVGDALAAKFKKLRIETIQDLIDYVPYRYEDYSKIIRVSQIKPGPVSLKVKISAIKTRYSKRGLHMTEALASDVSGDVRLVWFNQPYRASALKEDVEYYVSGEFASNYKFFAITNPACELVSDFPINTARLVPIYRLTKGLGVSQLRKVIKNAVKSTNYPETLPSWLLKEKDLLGKNDALIQMHFPSSQDHLKKAKKRLGFEEVFELTLSSELNKLEHKKQHSMQIKFDENFIKKFLESLPFKLTDDQRKVAWQIFQDMEKGEPMNRIVEGDVGSGKTIVAVMSALGAINQDYQAVLIAPTELLASQHVENISTLLESTNYSDKIIYLSGSMSKKQKENAYAKIMQGQAKFIIGTHAVFQKNVTYNNLGIVIVDEQHRFGVEQRKTLQSKANKMPHVLNMTATPIPRTLALTLYGEMDVSIIKNKPKGRIPINTKVEIRENRNKVYQKLSDEVSRGHQAFIVCPQIEESDNSNLSVKKVYEELSKNQLRIHKVALLHGKMKSYEKDQIMKAFLERRIDVIVSTTVIEVGVDVPNASFMVIEGAENFGLAQLHQLRGRIGRGKHNSYCYLILSSNDKPTQRMKYIERESNGFKLAEYDLELRGPGAIYGTMQHGELDLRVAKLTDRELISSARDAAKEFIKRGDNLLKYPQLKTRVDHLRTINNLN